MFRFSRPCLITTVMSPSVPAARLGGGSGRPQSGGVLHLAAQRGFSRPSVPCGRGRFRQRRVRRGLQGSRGHVPLAREEGAVPQEEEEEKFPQVQKTQLLKTHKWKTAMDAHVLLYTFLGGLQVTSSPDIIVHSCNGG